MQRHTVFLLIGGLVLFGLPSGCGRPAETTSEPPNAATTDPLALMQQAIQLGRWDDANQHADAVLIAFPDNPDSLALVARVKHETGARSDAADLLLEACKAESFSMPARVQQTVLALLGVGRLFDAVDLLDKSVSSHPQHFDLRRLLFDLLAGVEDLGAAKPHAELLIRQRHFDAALLLSLDTSSRRKEENRSYQQMVDLNPKDPRPLVGKSQTSLDHGNVHESIEISKMILEKFPNHTASRMILGRGLVESNQFDAAADWISTASTADRSNAWYWVIQGDLARQKQRSNEAIAAYWKAIERDDGLLQAWQKLGSAIIESLSQQPDHPVFQDALPIVRQQVQWLGELRQAKEDFQFSGFTSPAHCVRVAEILEQLGRLWEAEAWTAVAMTLPTKVDTAEPLRARLIGKLKRDTPWQLTKPADTSLKRLSSLDVADNPLEAERNYESPKRLKWTGGNERLNLQDVASTVGVNFFGKTSDVLNEPGLLLYATAGCGVGVIDFDNDGWPDLYGANAGGTPPNRDSRPNAMFRNLSGRFVDVTENSKTGDHGFAQGIAVGDVNEDGFPDVIVANYGPNRLLINNGDGTFADASDRLPNESAAESRWTTSVAIADFNGDGLSDFWEANYCAGLDATHQVCAGKEGGPKSSVCAPIAFKAERDRVFVAGTDGHFSDVTNRWTRSPSVLGRGLGIVAGELDGQPGLDVFVTNDMTDNHLWVQDRDVPDHKTSPKLVETATLRGLAGDGRSQPQGSMGIATGDINRDGYTDLYVTSFAAEYNTLHLQGTTAGFWNDQTSPMGLAEPTVSLVGFGTQAVDFDNDGNLELFVSNGHIDPLLQYAQPTQIFRRTAADKITCQPPSHYSGYMANNHVGRAVATTDFNRDGRQDLIVTHQTEPLAILENQTPTDHHWIDIRLAGRSCARDAIGTVIDVRAGDTTYTASHCSGSGYMASNEPVIHVGLGTYSGRVSITIRWPDGTHQTCDALATNQQWLVAETQEAFALSTDANR
ncbi:MAG: FG-GAP-like repeat-containing protein [Rubripirellula sp.]